MILNFTKTEVGPVEGRVAVVSGATITFNCYMWDTVGSSSAKVYRTDTGEDVTATVMPSGSVTESSTAITLKPLTALSGGVIYSVVITTTIGGDVWTKKIIVEVAKTWEAM